MRLDLLNSHQTVVGGEMAGLSSRHRWMLSLLYHFKADKLFGYIQKNIMASVRCKLIQKQILIVLILQEKLLSLSVVITKLIYCCSLSDQPQFLFMSVMVLAHFCVSK